MKLYYSKGACSIGVRITIHELKLLAEYESVDLKTKIMGNGQDYLKINPKGAVPALQLDNGEVLTENSVVHTYLADTHGSNLLPPMGNFQRYRVLEWLNYISTDLHKGASPFFNPQIPTEVKENTFKPVLLKKLAFVDKHLADKKFLMGNDFTIADSYLFVIIFWLPKLKIDTQPYPNLMRYFADLKARPAVHQAMKEEGFA